MARIVVAGRIAGDLERIVAHLIASDATGTPERIEVILQALEILATSPLIGRPCGSGRRELVIGKGRAGYLALYRYAPQTDTAFVLAIRSQREMSYPGNTGKGRRD